MAMLNNQMVSVSHYIPLACFSPLYPTYQVLAVALRIFFMRGRGQRLANMLRLANPGPWFLQRKFLIRVPSEFNGS